MGKGLFRRKIDRVWIFQKKLTGQRLFQKKRIDGAGTFSEKRRWRHFWTEKILLPGALLVDFAPPPSLTPIIIMPIW